MRDTAAMPPDAVSHPLPDDARMLSTREAAQYAHVSIDVITVWRVRGLLPATKAEGRWGFAPSNLDATLTKQHAGDARPR